MQGSEALIALQGKAGHARTLAAGPARGGSSGQVEAHAGSPARRAERYESAPGAACPAGAAQQAQRWPALLPLVLWSASPAPVVPPHKWTALPCALTPSLAPGPPSQMIARLGREINHPDSIYYWAWKNDIPVFCPALTGGSTARSLPPPLCFTALLSSTRLGAAPRSVHDCHTLARTVPERRRRAHALAVSTFRSSLARTHTCIQPRTRAQQPAALPALGATAAGLEARLCWPCG